MKMKTILLNGSPRKNWNTALMLKAAQKCLIFPIPDAGPALPAREKMPSVANVSGKMTYITVNTAWPASMRSTRKRCGKSSFRRIWRKPSQMGARLGGGR
jgi:hypothetical protein